MEHEEHHEHDEAVSAAPVEVITREPKKDRFLPISILVAAVVIGGSILFATLYRPIVGTAPSPAGTGNGGGNASSTAQAPTPLTPTQIMALGTRDAILGSPTAPVTMIEYGDYQCPYCGEYFSQTEPQIVQNYVTTGKVKLVFRNFPFLGPESTAAAEAAECAENQNQLWNYHDALYQAKVNDVAKGGSEDDGFFTRTLFLSIATKLNLDVPTFTNCIDTNAESSTVAIDVASATAAGVNSTPTFFINGTEIQGADPYATFQAAINTALGS
jgi:protein-disulfide isomerase